jgi:hypothetical protein
MKNGKTKHLKSKKRRGGKLDKDMVVTPHPQNEGGGSVRSTLRLSWVSDQKSFARSRVVKSDFERF